MQPGDTLSALARTHGVTVDQLRQWNGITGDRIDVGQVLVLEGGAVPPPGPAATRARPRRSSPRKSVAAGPRPKPCLEIGGDPGEHGIITAAGLTRDQLLPPLQAVAPGVLACSYPDVRLYRPIFVINVGCNGVISDLGANDPDGLGPETLSCIEAVLRTAEFPAHDMPDGMDFRYPMRIEPSG